ncbi:hypothetical protein QUF82_01075 [Thiotrichales bacterium HSG14]|nr:hypothetical protein [Thiotrichales bacterium HSG14]
MKSKSETRASETRASRLYILLNLVETQCLRLLLCNACVFFNN